MRYRNFSQEEKKNIQEIRRQILAYYFMSHLWGYRKARVQWLLEAKFKGEPKVVFYDGEKVCSFFFHLELFQVSS